MREISTTIRLANGWVLTRVWFDADARTALGGLAASHDDGRVWSSRVDFHKSAFLDSPVPEAFGTNSSDLLAAVLRDVVRPAQRKASRAA